MAQLKVCPRLIAERDHASEGDPMHLKAIPVYLTIIALSSRHARCGARFSDERIVFQTSFGNLELALYPEVSIMCLMPTTSC